MVFVRVESKPTDVSTNKKQFGCISFDKGGYYCIRSKRILFLLSDVEDIRTDLRMRIICIWIFGIKERIVCLMG